MTVPSSRDPVPLPQAAAHIFTASDAIDQLILEHLDPLAWRAPAPGRVRTIAAIVSHMHNVRRKWIRLSAPGRDLPAPLHRAHCTPQQAREALAASAAQCAELLLTALSGADADAVPSFHRDGWAPAWAPGVEMLCYTLSHEAHHRGQICMLAHQLGYPLPRAAANGLWNWEQLWRRLGFPPLSR